MQHSTKRRVAFGLSTVGLTTGGLLAAGFGLAAAAQADSTATGGAVGSPGVLSGNLAQLPVNVPVNICGNQATVIGALNTVAGNTCDNAGQPGNGAPASGGSGADATATGGAADSPGVLSGNLVQAPVNIPVNVCGDQLNVVGIGDTDAGNACSNGGGSDQSPATGASASGGTAGSPGVGSGNNVQVPVNAPVNACGNQVTVIGALNTVLGNDCSNGGGGSTSTGGTSPSGPGTPGTPGTPTCGCPSPTTPTTPTTPSTETSPASTSADTNSNAAPGVGSLAETGSGVLGAVPFAGGLLGGGSLLTRRFAPRS